MALIRRSSNVKKICDDFVQAVHFARSLIHCIIFRHSPSFVIKDMLFSQVNDCFLYSGAVRPDINDLSSSAD